MVDARLVASGTLGTPRATFSLEAHDLGTEQIQQVDARAGLLLEKGSATFDATVSLGGEPALALTAPVAVRPAAGAAGPGYLRGALERPLAAELAVTQLAPRRGW